MDSFSLSLSNTVIDDENLMNGINRARMHLSEIGNSQQPSSRNASFGLSKTSRLSFATDQTRTSFYQKNNQQSQLDSEKDTKTQSSIYTEFKLKSDQYIDQDLNFKMLLKSFASICAEQASFLSDQLASTSSYGGSIVSNRQALTSTSIEQNELEREKELWQLIKTLYFDEHGSKKDRRRASLKRQTIVLSDDDENDEDDNDNDEYEIEDTIMGHEYNEFDQVNYGVNESLLIKHLERKNPLFRRVKLVIDWLERNAAKSAYTKSIRDKISCFQEKCFSWEHTLHHLKNVNKKMQYSTREYVTELDPDAPIRQSKPLNDLDQEDEYKLMEYVFAFIRAGDINAARELCYKVGQSWRAATLEGSRLFSDDNCLRTKNNQSDAELMLNDGNLNRDIWRLIVHRLIKDDRFSKYEKAAYAALAGIVGPVLPVCRTYVDFIWTYLRAVYNQMIEKEIRARMPYRDFVNMPYDSDEDSLFNKLTSLHTVQDTLAQIFDRIDVLINNSGIGLSGRTNDLNNTNTGMTSMTSIHTGANSSGTSASLITQKEAAFLKADAQKPFSVILKYVILSGIAGFQSGTNDLMKYLKTTLNERKQSGNLLRFSAHLALFYQTASLPLKNELFTQVNEKYVQYLIDNNYKELIAYYLSHLSTTVQIRYYSKFLQNITDNKERMLLLKLAKERNMNVQEITLNIVDNLSKQQQHEFDETTNTSKLYGQPNRTQQVDFLMISSLNANMSSSTGSSFRSGQQLNDEDKAKINALDWIVYDPMQRFKLLEYANLTMRYFLLKRQNFEATKIVYSKIPSDTLTHVLHHYNCSIDAKLHQVIEMLPKNVSNSIKEYLCFKEYIEAIDMYNEWFEYFHKEKPTKPTSGTSGSSVDSQLDKQQTSSNFAERIALDYQLKQYEDLKSRWYSKAVQHSSRIKLKFFHVLMFPNGGWMMDIDSSSHSVTGIENDDCISNDGDDDEDDEENEREVNKERRRDVDSDTDMRSDEENDEMASGESRESLVKEKTHSEKKGRQEQMRELRKLYLPSIFFLLSDMFNKMELYDDVIKLADLIADKQYNLVSLFTSSQLKNILNKIADASISLLDKNRDYLGYS